MSTRLILATTMTAGLLLPSVTMAQTAGGRGTPAAPPTVQAPRAVQPTPVDPRLWPQAFSVVLVVGEMEGTQGSDAVPAAARKALTDLRDFLPYKNYRLLDSQWTLCCGKGSLFSRLRGLDGQEYELNLTASITQASGGDPAPTVNVQFFLNEARDSQAEAAALRKQIEDLRKRQELADRGLAPSPASDTRAALEMQLKLLEGQLASTTRRPASRSVINTSFRMDVGETVVVGTSRIHGDKALIALLTAVPPKPKK
jgi:hypothetical protein